MRGRGICQGRVSRHVVSLKWLCLTRQLPLLTKQSHYKVVKRSRELVYGGALHRRQATVRDRRRLLKPLHRLNMSACHQSRQARQNWIVATSSSDSPLQDSGQYQDVQLSHRQHTLPDGCLLELLEVKPIQDSLLTPQIGPPLLFVHGANHAAWCWAVCAKFASHFPSTVTQPALFPNIYPCLQHIAVRAC